MMLMALIVLLATVPAFAEAINFDSEKPGAMPSDWAVAMTHSGGPPKWETRSDESAPSPPNVLAQVSDDRISGRYPLAIYQKADLRDGELSVKLKPLSGKVDASGGLVWRYRDENNYYVVRSNALENNTVLYKVENGKRSSLAPTGMPADTYGVKHTVPSRRWATLGARFEGNLFTVFFNGKQLFQVEDSTFSEAGKVGLWTKADAVTHFDDFQITR